MTVKPYGTLRRRSRPLVVGDAEAIDVCGAALTVDRVAAVGDAILVFDLDNVDTLVRGEMREAYGSASLERIERAIELARAGSIDAITTAPIHKQATELAGSEYAGHTGMLADYTDTNRHAMLLVEEDLRVSHVSTHVPLREACDRVTSGNVLETIRVTDKALRELGIDSPRIGVAGLNPHAGDGGLLGDEDAEEIRPAVERARESGIDAVGPESPDTVYIQAADGAYDCVVAMYHDQGHIPIKMAGFSGGNSISGVNVTIGLPIIRTSVDHGTAFDISGEGIASETSLVQAVDIAVDMAIARATRAER